MVVLDAWPVIEAVQGEEPSRSAPPKELFRDPGRAVMSIVNFTETRAGVLRNLPSHEVPRIMRDIRESVTILSLDNAVAAAASCVKHAYKVALGDSFAIATAMSIDAEVWSGDPELLCADRIWKARDLRSPAMRAHHDELAAHRKLHAGRSPVGYPGWTLEQIREAVESFLVASEL